MEFITGRAGSGKSRCLIDRILQDTAADPLGPPILLIVPDQAAFYMESWLTRQASERALVRAQVLSFRRLASQAQLALGSASRIPLQMAGKFAVFARVFDLVRDSLSVLGRASVTPRYLGRLLELLEECQSYNLSAKDLRLGAKTNGLKSQFVEKLEDLALLIETYRQRIDGLFVDPYDLLPHFAEHAAKWDFLRQAAVYIDGFAGYTAQELQVIRSLLPVVAQCTLTVGAPLEVLQAGLAGHLALHSPFAQAQDSFCRLQKLVAEVDGRPPIYTDLDVGTPMRFAHTPQLAHLEENLFQVQTNVYRRADSSSPQGLRLATAPNKEAEVAGVIGEMLALRRSHALKWEDFVLVVPSLQTYAAVLGEAFSSAEIPSYMDERRSLRQHSLAIFVIQALRLADTNFASAELFKLLKTDVFPLSRDTVDQLENFTLSRGITGRQWLVPFSGARGNPVAESLHSGRQKIAGILGDFVRAVQSPELTVRVLAQALWDLLERVDAAHTIARWITRAESVGDFLQAEMHERAYEATVAALDEFVAALGAETVTLAQATMLVTQAYEGMTIGVIPAQVHQVLVTEVDRIRAFEAPAVFVLGCVEGWLPRRPVEDDVFSDDEREQLADLGQELGPSSARRQLFERYRVYMALTRATRWLTLSCPESDEDGRALSPSLLLSQIRMLFAEGEIVQLRFGDKPVGDDARDARLCATSQSAALHLAGVLCAARRGVPISPLWYGVYDLFAGAELAPDLASKALRGLAHAVQSDRLAVSLASQVYGTDILTSVSRLEVFAACAFAHFANYGLKLRERERFAVNDGLRGALLHEVLHLFTQRTADEGLPWGQLSDSTVLQWLDDIFTDRLTSFHESIFASSARARNAAWQVRSALTRALLVLTEHARRSSFVPHMTELAFGDGDGALPPLSVPLRSGQLRLRGRIDRVDIASDGDRMWYRVIDYKSSAKQFSLSRVYHGLMLQLPLYAHVFERFSTSVLGQSPEFAGVFYFPVMDPIQSVPSPVAAERIQEELRRPIRMKGMIRRESRIVQLLDAKQVETGATDLYAKMLKKDGDFESRVLAASGEQWERMREHVLGVIQDYGKQMSEGVTDINPFKVSQTEHACAFCGYRAVCQFEPQHGLGSYRYLPSYRNDEVWEQLATNGGLRS